MLKKVVHFSFIFTMLTGLGVSAQSGNEPKLAASSDSKPVQSSGQTKTGSTATLSAAGGSNSRPGANTKKQQPKLAATSGNAASRGEKK